MQLVSEARFAAIDFESAGTARGGTDCPIQIGMACWSLNKGITDRFVSFIHTDQPVQWSAQKVHGISTADLHDAPTLLSLWPEIRTRLRGAVVVAHGKGTEKRFLRGFPGHGFGPWIDTLTLSRAVWPGLAAHSLSAVCQGLDLSEMVAEFAPGKNWHDALFDSLASLLILEKAIQALGLHRHTVDELVSPDTSVWNQSRSV